MKQNPYDNLAALSTPSKLSTTLSRKTIQAYLKAAGYLRFKALRKLYLTKKHKKARLHWAREHLRWTLEDWKGVIWTDEATFETGLDLRTYYVTQKPGTAMESLYLKPTFKSGQTTLGIWDAITLGKKGPIHFLIKEGRMTLQIYVDQVFKQLGLPFYNKLKEDKRFMISMHDSASYHTSKLTTKFCY